MKNLIILLLVCFNKTYSQNKMPYAIFSKDGKKTNYEKLIQKAQKTNLVLFGELHNNSIIHWLQFEFVCDLSENKKLVLGAEMIESDNQEALNLYLNNKINQKKLDSLARLWPNFNTDYKPLVDFAKEKKIPFIATNIPRRFASMVFKKDLPVLETLTLQEKNWIAPLPIQFDLKLPGYKAMLQMQGGHAGDKMPKAQAVKDATMAYFIEKNQIENSIFVHFNGTYHSDNFEGIYWYLKQKNNNLNSITIATVEQSQLKKLNKEHLNKADFIIVVDENVTKTY